MLRETTSAVLLHQWPAMLKTRHIGAYRDLLVQTLHDMRDVRSARTTQRAHEEILDAIRSRDPAAARTLMLAHLQDFEKRLRRWLQTKEETEVLARAKRRPAVARTG